MLKRLLTFLFPPSRWTGCDPPTRAQRLANYELRLGQHRAEQRMRAERVDQLFDERASVQPKVTPKLPRDNVVAIRRRKA